MAGLVASFDAAGHGVSIEPLVQRFPTHAMRRDDWQDRYCRVARLHHDLLNASPQPVWHAQGTIALVSDGYLASCDDESGPDRAGAPELWLRLYEEGRAEAFAQLNGSFALLIYDAARRCVSLISDRHNSRPLYYFINGSEIVVASQIAALTAHPRCPRMLDRQALHELVAFQRVLGDGTIYRGIQRLPPAAILRFDGRTPRMERYWRLRWREPAFSRREAPGILADAIRRAARRWLPPRARCGLLLSGGLDSRAILAAAEPPPVCFTQAPVENDEVEIAREAARRRGAEFHYVPVESAHYARDFDEMVRLSGGMQRGHASHFLSILETVKRHCDVLASGYGFDAIYRGHELPARRLHVGRLSIPLPMLQPVDRSRLLPAVLASASYVLPNDAVQRVLTPQARAEHDACLERCLSEQLADFQVDGRCSVYDAWDWLALRSIAQDDAFPNVLCIRSRMDDRIISLDRDLFDVYLQMPPQWRHPDAVYLAALRQLFPRPLAGLKVIDTGLPASVPSLLATPLRTIMRGLSRRSTSPRRQHSWPHFAALLRAQGPFRDRAAALSKDGAFMSCGIFDRAGLRATVDEHLQARRDHTKLLMMLLTIDSWLDQFGADGVA